MRPARDITGLRIHKITVLHRAWGVASKNPHWKYQCDCGKVKTARADLLYKGKQKSCGCERLQNKFIDLTGKRFGRLVAQWPSGKTSSGKTGGGTVHWLCLCDCGKMPVIAGKSLRAGVTNSCGCLQRDTFTTHGKSKTSDFKMLCSAKSRAKKAGVPFDLRLEDILIPDTCPILGISLLRNKGKGPTANSPTIDRLIPSLGYVRGNISIVSHRANQIKNDATLDELNKIVNWMEGQQKDK